MNSPLRILAIIFFFTALQSSHAQNFPSEIWHDGFTVLIEGDTLKGKIKYDFVNDLIQIDRRGTLQTYSARKILYFKIRDEMAKNDRIIYSLPYSVHSDYEVPILFEILYEGKLTLLSREEIVTKETDYGTSTNTTTINSTLEPVVDHFRTNKSDWQKYGKLTSSNGKSTLELENN